MQGITTDLDWVREHTRLLTRALEWDTHRRDGGYLLRGKDLADAEAWLSGAQGKEPVPQPVQTAFIVASRALATRRTQALLAAVAAALMVSVSLTIYALVQRSHAIREARIALGRQLAVQARSLMDERHDQALLLAVEASALHKGPETRAALVAALYRDPRLVSYVAPPLSGLTLVTAHPQSGRLAAAGGAGPALYSSRTGRAQHVLAGGASDLVALQFSMDGRIVVGGFRDGTVLAWDASTAAPIPLSRHPERRVDEQVVALAVGRELAFSVSKDAGTNHLLSVWDLREGREVRRLAPPVVQVRQRGPRGDEIRERSTAIHHIALNNDGRLLAAANPDGDVFLLDTEGLRWRLVIAGPRTAGVPDGTPAVGGVPSGGLAFNGDGRWLAVGTREALLVYDLGLRQVADVGEAKDATALAFSPDSRFLAVGSSAGAVRLWDTSEFSLFSDETPPAGPPMAGPRRPVTMLAFDSDGTQFLAATEDGAVAWWEPGQGVAWTLVKTEGEGELLMWAAPGFDWKIAWNQARMDFFDMRTRVVMGTVDRQDPEVAARMPPGIVGLGFSPDGKLFAGGFHDGTVMLWQTVGGTRYAIIEDTGRTGGARVVFSPDGRRLAVMTKVGVLLWDVAEKHTVACLDLERETAQALAFSPDGSRVAWGASFRVGTWDVVSALEDAKCVKESAAPGSRSIVSKSVRALAFSPDGEHLMVSTADRTVSTLVAETLEEIPSRRLGNLEDAAHILAYSVSGDLLVGAVGERVHLWDARTLVPAGSVPGPGKVGSLVFGAGDGVLLTSYTVWPGESGIISNVIDQAALQEAACLTANRSLDETEWQRLVGTRAYEPSCSGPGEAP